MRVTSSRTEAAPGRRRRTPGSSPERQGLDLPRRRRPRRREHHRARHVRRDRGVSSSRRRRSQRRQLRRAQGCAGSLSGQRLAAVGEPRPARDRWREGRARPAGRSRIERRDDPRVEGRSRALCCNAGDVGWPRGAAARTAGAVRAIFARDEIAAIRAVGRCAGISGSSRKRT
jgi:hypothetical protein